MSELRERDELSLAHFPFGLLHERTLFGGERIVRINHTAGLDEHAIFLFGERNKIAFVDVESFKHLPWNDHLAPLPDATDSLPGCG